MTLRALIFDVDGTLAETEEAHREAFNICFAEEKLGWHWSVEDYTRLLKTTGGKERMRADRDEKGLRHPSDQRIAEMHKRKTEIYAEIVASGGLGLRPGVAALIEKARGAGLRLAIATTTNRPNVEVLCQASWNKPADEIFDVIAAGDEVAAKKPAADVFELALARLNLPPEACIAFEDSLNGLKSARGAGLRVVVTPSIYTAQEDFGGATWVLPDLSAEHLPSALQFPN